MANLVSVITPAFNAEATIAGTLASALAQVGIEFEIIVADDGSTDGTARIVAEIAARDARVRLVSGPSGGVARARNLALSEARGNFIAPLDADDLWHPDKLARQVARIEEAGPDFALVYNWFRRIDEDDMVIAGSPRPMVQGQVFYRHLSWNFISNGSTPLIRHAALADIRYDPKLRDCGLQGCEDYLLQLQLARRYKFACVPAFLTGYRRAPGAMSRNVERMIRSHIMMFQMMTDDAGEAAGWIIRRQLARLHVELARNNLGRLRAAEVMRNLGRALGMDRAMAVRSLRHEVMRSLRGRHRQPPSLERDFATFRAEEIDGPWTALRSIEALGQLAAMDQESASGLPDHLAREAF